MSSRLHQELHIHHAASGILMQSRFYSRGKEAKLVKEVQQVGFRLFHTPSCVRLLARVIGGLQQTRVREPGYRFRELKNSEIQGRLQYEKNAQPVRFRSHFQLYVLKLSAFLERGYRGIYLLLPVGSIDGLLDEFVHCPEVEVWPSSELHRGYFLSFVRD